MKAIDPSARETARALARRSGLALGEWANRLLQEEEAAQVQPPPIRVAALGRPPAPAPDPAPSAEVVAALDRLTQRMERSEQSAADLIGGVEQTLANLSHRLEAGEREQGVVVARFEAAVEDLRGAQSRMAERLQQVEDEAASSKVDAQAAAADRFRKFESRTKRALAGVRDELDGLHGHVAEANAEAVGIVDAGLARLVERLQRAETQTAQVLKGVAGVLAERSGTAGQARDDLDARFDRIEQVLQAIGEQARAAEQQSARTVERLEQALSRTAGDLTRKIDGVEQRSAAAVHKLAGEVARIADVVQTRLAGAAAAADRSREALAGQIARISEGLAGRLADSEQRSAAACDEVTAQVAALGQRLQAHQEAVASELAEQVKQSEIRAARMLEDARERVRREAPEPRRETLGPPPPRPPSVPVDMNPPAPSFGVSRRDGAGRRWTDTVYDAGFGARGVPVHAAPDLFAVDAAEGRAEWTPTVQKLMDQARSDEQSANDDAQQTTFGWLLRFGKKHRA